MKRRLLSILALAAALGAQAVPANPRPFVYRQPDGTLITVTLVGDEFEHYYLTSDGQRLTEGDGGWLVPQNAAKQQGAAEQSGPEQLSAAEQSTAELQSTSNLRAAHGAALRAKRASALGHYPTLGSPRELVLLVEYPDCRFEHSAETFRRMLCEEGYNDDGATGSAFDYFADQSRHLFTPDITVVGPVMLPHPRAYYGTPTANMYDAQPWLMLTDAAPQVDAEVDFSQFDNDGDGFVDNVFIFYAGEGQNDGGPLEAVWPHAANIWTYYALDCTLDGVQLGSYACTNELTGAGRLTGIGTFVHEYSHILGLPDLYSTQGASNCFSPGAFEVMDSGAYNNEGRTPPNMSAYDLTALGWAMAEPLTAPETVILQPPSTPQSEALSRAGGGEGRPWEIRSIATVKPEEYYLLENRQQVGWDAYIPGHGMLIWHIDYDARAWADNQVNVLPAHQRVDLVEADGVLSADTQDGDPFPGVRQTTAVNLLPWTGVPIDAAITEIKEAPLRLLPLGGGLDGAESWGGLDGGVITFKFRGGGERIEAPVALDARGVEPCGFTACWTGVPAVTDYEVIVWRGDEAVPTLSVGAAQAAASATGWTAAIAGLEPSTRYRYAVVALDGERRSPQSNEVYVTTLPPTFDMLAPDDLTADPYCGAASWRLTWTPLDEAVAYEVEIYGHRVVAPDVATLDFTGGLSALPFGWTTTSTQTSGVAGTFGASRPSLLLQPGEYLQSPVFAEGIVDYSLWSLGEIKATLLQSAASPQAQAPAQAAGPKAQEAGPQAQAAAPQAVSFFEAVPQSPILSQAPAPAAEARAKQLRLTNTGETPAYVDDVVVTYGGAVEQTAVETFATTDKTGTAADLPSTPSLIVTPQGGGALWARVRGLNADGIRSRWSAEVPLPLLEGIAAPNTDTRPSNAPYSIPPFIIITPEGRKAIRY